MGLRNDLDPSATTKRGGEDTQELLAMKEAGSFETVTGILNSPHLFFVVDNDERQVPIAVGTENVARELKYMFKTRSTEWVATDVIWHDVTTCALPERGDALVGVGEPWSRTRLLLMPVFTGTAKWSKST